MVSVNINNVGSAVSLNPGTVDAVYNRSCVA